MSKNFAKSDKPQEVYPLHYHKPNSICLADISYPHSFFSDKQHLGESIQQLQLYHPFYSTFFELNENNYNTIGLNHRYQIKDLHTIIDTKSTLANSSGGKATFRVSSEEAVSPLPETTISQEVFIKFSPLLDPIKYMVGKYELTDPRLKTLPTFQSTKTECHEKLLSSTNASYIDGFFYYLNSILKNHHHFIHGIDFYGSYLGIQDRYKMNVEEDSEYLTTSSFFLSNIGKLMVLENVKENQLPYSNSGSRGVRKQINIDNSNNPISLLDLGIVELDMNHLVQEPVPPPLDISEQSSTDVDIIYQKVTSNKNSSDDEEDSSTSDDDDEDTNEDTNTDEHAEFLCEEDEDEEKEDWETESYKTESCEENDAMVYIFDFPVQMICLEKCTDTLDSLFVQGISEEESASALFQVIMILLVYQKMFQFTHNDLHTNNIMFIETTLPYLTYKYQDIMYRVPTYGRIFKIIDFGRSIFKYQKHVFCSDSFATGGDAATQYNCEPFFKSSKPRLEPSMSFDLCRLGCSIYDFIFDDEDITKNEKMKKNELQRTIQRWCTDSMGKNVLYKKNGQERYPGFRLYKMIARTVHEHTPEKQLGDPWFLQFKMTDQEQYQELDEIMNIDLYPTY